MNVPAYLLEKYTRPTLVEVVRQDSSAASALENGFERVFVVVRDESVAKEFDSQFRDVSGVSVLYGRGVFPLTSALESFTGPAVVWLSSYCYDADDRSFADPYELLSDVRALRKHRDRESFTVMIDRFGRFCRTAALCEDAVGESDVIGALEVVFGAGFSVSMEDGVETDDVLVAMKNLQRTGAALET